MADIKSQAVKLMAEEIIRAINKITDDNNRGYVNNQIANHGGSGGGSGGGGGVFPGVIPASQVSGLTTAIANYIYGAPQQAAEGDVDAGRVISTLNGLSALVVQSATIDTAQIENLYSSYGEFINLVAEKAHLEEVDTEELYAQFAEMGLSNIGTANIGFGQIKDLVAGTAIIRQGVGGELYIDTLAVTDANMVSLTTGELMLKNSDGQFVRIVVDSDTGEVSGEPVTFDGDDVFNNNSLSGTKIIENSITARELNVSQIFADQALIRAIKASNIDVASLFADITFTNQIKSPQIGNEIDLSNNPSITMAKGLIKLMISDDAYYIRSISNTDVKSAFESTAHSSYATNGYRRVFFGVPEPPYTVGDLWLYDDNTTKYCITSKENGEYSQSDWNDSSQHQENISNFVSSAKRQKTKYQYDIGNSMLFVYSNSDPSISTMSDVQKYENTGNFYYNLNTGNCFELTYEIDTKSSITVTDKLVEAVGDKFSIIADDIDLSANNSIIAKIRNQVHRGTTPPSTPEPNGIWVDTSGTEPVYKKYVNGNWVVINDISDLPIGANELATTVLDVQFRLKDAIEASVSRIDTLEDETGDIEERLSDAELAITPEQITATVLSETKKTGANKTEFIAQIAGIAVTPDSFNTVVGNQLLDGTTNISQINQTASKINLVVGNGSSVGSLSLTQDMLNAIASKVNLMAQDPTSSLSTQFTLTPSKLETVIQNSDSSTIIKSIIGKIDATVSSVDGQGNVTLTDKALTAIADEIELTTSDLSIVVGNLAQGKVDNLKIGSRNYIRNSKSLNDAEQIITAGVYQTGSQLHIVSGVTVAQDDDALHIG